MTVASLQWTEDPSRPGEAVMRSHDDGTVTVVHADPVIAVRPEVLAELAPPHLEADGTLVLDTAGEYRYQRVGEQGDHSGRTLLIYRRVQRPRPGL